MPELPDLQVFSRNLNKKLAGKKLKEITVKNDSKLKASKAAFKKSLEDHTLDEIYREGKELRFRFKNKEVLGMHLMLNGDLHLYEGKHDHKHPIVEMVFDDGTGLVLTDYQGMANISLNPEEKDAPDALSKELNASFLMKLLSKKRTAIKTLLLDQKMIRGIGNAYADEILWDAGISPFSISNKIPEDRVKKLAASIHKVLTHAEKEILKKDPDIISGEIRDFLLIHNSRKKESPTGGKIENKMLNARKTYYTDEQELYE